MSDKKSKVELTLYDKFIGFFSPRAQAQRMKYKAYSDYLQRSYEGASAGRRTKGWDAPNRSANSVIASGLVRLRDRSRDLIRNNPYASRGIQVITNNVIGRGIVTQIKVDDNARTNRREEQLNATWRAWTETKGIDFEGKHDLKGLQRLIMRSVAESGEVIIRKRRVGRRRVVGPDGVEREVPPIAYQVLESDFLASNRLSGRLQNGNFLKQGIEIDSAGRVVAYHLFKEHPGGVDVFTNSNFKTVRVPAGEIRHPYRIDRPGQLRGVPWLAPVMLRLRDFDLYEDAQLKRQQCAAMFTAFVHDLEAFDETAEAEEETELGEKLEPGLIEILSPGKDIKFTNPPSPDNYKEYTSVVLHSIATGLGITFESLTSDFSEVNFSSARMGFLEMQRNIDTWRNNVIISDFLEPAVEDFKEGAEVLGLNVRNARAVHTPPRREMIDPTKEVGALKTAVRSGFKTISDAIREGGQDPDTHFEELRKDNERLDELGLILDTDPRKVNNSGSINEANSTEGGGNETNINDD